jgi:hypothetical protein
MRGPLAGCNKGVSHSAEESEAFFGHASTASSIFDLPMALPD